MAVFPFFSVQVDFTFDIISIDNMNLFQKNFKNRTHQGCKHVPRRTSFFHFLIENWHWVQFRHFQRFFFYKKLCSEKTFRHRLRPITLLYRKPFMKGQKCTQNLFSTRNSRTDFFYRTVCEIIADFPWKQCQRHKSYEKWLKIDFNFWPWN